MLLPLCEQGLQLLMLRRLEDAVSVLVWDGNMPQPLGCSNCTHPVDWGICHCVSLQIDVPRFMSDGQRLAELIQAVKLQHQQEQLQQLLTSDS